MIKIIQLPSRPFKRVIIAIIGLLAFVLLILSGLGIIHERYDYVVLPNGAILVETGWLKSNIALKNPDGKRIVLSDVKSIIWNDSYVAGSAHKEDNEQISTSVNFIYKIDSANLKIFANKDLGQSYYEALDALDMSDLSTDSNEYSNAIDKTFEDLIKDKRYHRSWFYFFNAHDFKR